MDMQFFRFDNPTEELQETFKPIYDLAQLLNARLEDSEEKEIGLRKLLEAKDCFLRCVVKKKEGNIQDASSQQMPVFTNLRESSTEPGAQ